jgi:predicted nucleotidyltransferase
MIIEYSRGYIYRRKEGRLRFHPHRERWGLPAPPPSPPQVKTELERFVDRWSRDPSIRKIILFGSAARGDVRCDSDLDLVVVQETDKKFLSRLEPFYRDARIAMDILVYTPDEFAAMQEGIFLKNALQDGVVLYEAGARKRRNPMAETGRTRP